MDIFERVRTGDLETLRSLVTEANMNAADPNGQTLLHVAAARGQPEIAAYLIAMGADVNKRAEDGKTALHYAATYQDIEIVTALIEAGADLSIKDKHGNAPLWDAMSSSRKSYDLVDFMLFKGADPTSVNNAGRSVSSVAVERNSQALLAVLSKH
jgi:uncharacterized protein